MELFQFHGGRWVRVVSIGIGDVMRKQSPMIVSVPGILEGQQKSPTFTRPSAGFLPRAPTVLVRR